MRYPTALALALAMAGISCGPGDGQQGNRRETRRTPSTKLDGPRIKTRSATPQWRMLFGDTLKPRLRILAAGTEAAGVEERFCSVAPVDTHSDLSKIEVVLAGNTGALYSNDFFAGHPDAASFRPFYPASTLPSNARPTTPYQEPGKFATVAGFNGVVLALTDIGCTSRYGGSIRLRFTSTEDLQYDFGDGTYLWDFDELELRVFVVPAAASFNAPTSARNAIVHVEAEPREVTRYAAATRDVTPATASDPALDGALQTAANAIEGAASRTITTNVAGNAASFVSGYLRARFNDRFQNWTELVDAVDVSDDFVDLTTRTGAKQYYLAVKINWIDLNTEPGGEEFEVDIINMANGEDVRNIELDEDEASSWQTIARVAGNQCSGGEIYPVNVNIDETDPGFDDHFHVSTQWVELNCAELAAATSVGVVETWGSDNLTIYKGASTERAGWISISFRVGVLLR